MTWVSRTPHHARIYLRAAFELQVLHLKGSPAAAALLPLVELQRNIQAQLAWLTFMGATLLLALAAGGINILSTIATAGRQRSSCKFCRSTNISVCFVDCDDSSDDFYAPGVGSAASSCSGSSSESAAACCAAAGAPVWPQLRVRAPQAIPAAASSGSASAAGFDPGTPAHQCRRRRPSLLWTIPE